MVAMRKDEAVRREGAVVWINGEAYVPAASSYLFARAGRPRKARVARPAGAHATHDAHDDAHEPRFILTVWGTGYKFADV